MTTWATRAFRAFWPLALFAAPLEGATVWVGNPDGGFVAFDLATARVESAWSLAEVRGLGVGTPREPEAGAPPAPQLSLAEAPEGVLLALPAPIPNDAEGRARYRIVRVALGGLQRLTATAEWNLPQPLATPPRLLVSPDGGRALVWWRDAQVPGAAYVYRIAELELPGLAEVVRRTALVPTPPPGEAADLELPLLADGSRFTRDGGAILDRSRIVRLGATTFSASRLRFQPDADLRARLDRYSPPGPDGRPSYVLAAVGAENGKVLYLVRSERREVTGDMVFTLDPETGVSTPLLDVPRCQAALLPDGRRIVIQEVEAPADRALSSTRASGKFQLLEAASGARLASFASPLLEGGLENVRLRCVSPGGDVLIYRGGHAEVVVVELSNDKVWSPNVAFSADLEAQCAFVEN